MFVFFSYVYDDFLTYICNHINGALRNLPYRALHVFSSCLVCFEELTFLLMFFPKWLRDKQSALQ